MMTDKQNCGKGEIIECPNCKHQFDSAETFEWLIDDYGHPTIEYLSCPLCNVATLPIFSCNICPNRLKCTLEEECDATLYYKYDDWKVVDTLKEKKAVNDENN